MLKPLKIVSVFHHPTIFSLRKTEKKNSKCIVWPTKLQKYDSVSNYKAKKDCQDTNQLV